MLPYPLRLRSGVIFATLPGLLLVGFWSAAVTYVHLYHYNLQVDEGLVSLLGLVTAIAIAFKLCAGYHRYQDARTQWTRLTICIRNLARLIWFNVPDGPRAPLQQSHACSAKSGPWPPPTQMQVERKLREDLLCKASAIRLLVGFAVALKRHVRGEYGTEWPDVRSRVGYLPTLARRGPQTQISVSQTLYTTMDPEKGLPAIPPPTSTSWPRSLFSTPPPHPPPHPQPAVIPSNTAITQHNLPLEILGFLGSYAGYLACERKLSGSGGLSGAVQRELATLGDILGRCEALLEEGSMPVITVYCHHRPDQMALPPAAPLPAPPSHELAHHPRRRHPRLHPPRPLIRRGLPRHALLRQRRNRTTTRHRLHDPRNRNRRANLLAASAPAARNRALKLLHRRRGSRGRRTEIQREAETRQHVYRYRWRCRRGMREQRAGVDVPEGKPAAGTAREEGLCRVRSQLERRRYTGGDENEGRDAGRLTAAYTTRYGEAYNSVWVQNGSHEVMHACERPYVRLGRYALNSI